MDLLGAYLAGFLTGVLVLVVIFDFQDPVDSCTAACKPAAHSQYVDGTCYCSNDAGVTYVKRYTVNESD